MPFCKNLNYFTQRYLFQRKKLLASGPYGTRFAFRTEDAVGRGIYKREWHEKTNTLCLLDICKIKSSGVFLDIGANLGWYSVLLGTVYPKLNIQSFEPDPLNHALFQENIGLNGCKNIEAHAVALADTEQEKTLYLYPHKNRGRHSLLPTKGAEQVKVPCTTIDAFCEKQNIQEIDLLKIDIEGYEYFAFLGASKMLARTNHLFMEFSPNLYTKDASKEMLLDLLISKGFSPHYIDESSKLVATSREALIGEERIIDLFWTRAQVTAASTAS